MTCDYCEPGSMGHGCRDLRCVRERLEKVQELKRQLYEVASSLPSGELSREDYSLALQLHREFGR